MPLEEAIEIIENMIFQRENGAIYALDMNDAKALKAMLESVEKANA